MNDEAVIKINDLTVAYEGNPALWNINLNIKKGVLMAVVGPNGAGKSTLIKAILNLIKPVTGNITFYGKSYKSQRNKIKMLDVITSKYKREFLPFYSIIFNNLFVLSI